jgi:hypothetical protein
VACGAGDAGTGFAPITALRFGSEANEDRSGRKSQFHLVGSLRRAAVLVLGSTPFAIAVVGAAPVGGTRVDIPHNKGECAGGTLATGLDRSHSIGGGVAQRAFRSQQRTNIVSSPSEPFETVVFVGLSARLGSGGRLAKLLLSTARTHVTHREV